MTRTVIHTPYRTHTRSGGSQETDPRLVSTSTDADLSRLSLPVNERTGTHTRIESQLDLTIFLFIRILHVELLFSSGNFARVQNFAPRPLGRLHVIRLEMTKGPEIVV